MDEITTEYVIKQAAALLRCLDCERLSDDGYVFPGRDLVSPMSNMTMLKRLKDLSGDPKATTHGLRGTFRTWAQDEGLDETIAEHCMQHIVGHASAKAYRHGTVRSQSEWAGQDRA